MWEPSLRPHLGKPSCPNCLIRPGTRTTAVLTSPAVPRRPHRVSTSDACSKGQRDMRSTKPDLLAGLGTPDAGHLEPLTLAMTRPSTVPVPPLFLPTPPTRGMVKRTHCFCVSCMEHPSSLRSVERQLDPIRSQLDPNGRHLDSPGGVQIIHTELCISILGTAPCHR